VADRTADGRTRDDLDQTRLNALSGLGFALGIVAMMALGMRWVVDLPSLVELAALVLLIVAAGAVLSGLMMEWHRSGFSAPRVFRMLVRAAFGLFVSLRSWFLP
jgi:hypothetical protein